jgi:hypothetical protein
MGFGVANKGEPYAYVVSTMYTHTYLSIGAP